MNIGSLKSYIVLKKTPKSLNWACCYFICAIYCMSVQWINPYLSFTEQWLLLPSPAVGLWTALLPLMKAASYWAYSSFIIAHRILMIKLWFMTNMCVRKMTLMKKTGIVICRCMTFCFVVLMNLYFKPASWCLWNKTFSLCREIHK